MATNRFAGDAAVPIQFQQEIAVLIEVAGLLAADSLSRPQAVRPVGVVRDDSVRVDAVRQHARAVPVELRLIGNGAVERRDLPDALRLVSLRVVLVTVGFPRILAEQ